MNLVDDYINNFDNQKKEWFNIFISFMRENFPNTNETISYGIPMYKFNKQYIAFSAAKNHFSFHTLDFKTLEELKRLFPNAKFGKGCIKIKYENKEIIPILLDMCRKIVERSASTNK